jgi:PAS domain S-box-containing protein
MRIRTQIILLYFAGLSLIVAVAAYSNHAGQRLLLEEAGRQSRDMAVQLIHQIGHELDVQINYMTAVLHDGKLEAFLAESNLYFSGLNARDAYIARQEEIWRGATSVQSIDTPFSITLRNRFALFGKTSHGAQRYADIFLTNRYGVVVAQTSAINDYCHADEAWWRHAKKDGVAIEGIHYAEGAKPHGLVMALRIDDPNGNFAGAIKAEVPIISILRNARMTPKRYETTEIEIFTRRGIRLYSTVSGEAFADVSGMPFFKKQTGQKGNFRDPTAHPGQMIAFASSEGIQSFRGLEWVLALKHDQAEILAKSHLLEKKIFYGVAICALLALAAAGLMIKRIIKPIRQLRDATQAVADGDLKKQIKVKGRDEMAQLARSFNRMTSVHDVSYMQLKQRIAACRIAQVQLKDNEQRLFQFLEAMPVGVYIADHTGAYYFANQAAREILGEGIVGEAGSDPQAHLYVAGTDEPYPKAKMPINQALGGQSVAVDDMEIHHPGRTIPVMIWASPVFDARGKVIFATAAFSDMSEQREAENRLKAAARELKRSNAELEQFAYIASHDLQEPLRKVGSYMELVAERYHDQLDQDGSEFIDYAVDGARRMKVMINARQSASLFRRGPFEITSNGPAGAAGRPEWSRDWAGSRG